ncbi:CBS domain-containing protein [Actinomadura montaniterrae]|uniref:CBS domain-containing protein n=1 Tax=Actinomadura montaniterrae TaxID=1803903 RepID=A0A6L3VX11_9ACTN|nr:CBS domain-containing protein [Actinomadura montaniterrae]KAB2384672.1 CBS domain-containing protein [Actinomadura montaniterrae]
MRIREILRRKGDTVATVTPDATVRQLLAVLAEHNIGAAVVSPDGTSIAGIVTERDVVRRMHDRGAGLLDRPVSEIMTADVHTCGPGEDLEDLRRTMTENRFRHVPVVDGGRLAGIVSIGDVVKSAIDELESEREHLVDYIQRAP